MGARALARQRLKWDSLRRYSPRVRKHTVPAPPLRHGNPHLCSLLYSIFISEDSVESCHHVCRLGCHSSAGFSVTVLVSDDWGSPYSIAQPYY